MTDAEGAIAVVYEDEPRGFHYNPFMGKENRLISIVLCDSIDESKRKCRNVNIPLYGPDLSHKCDIDQAIELFFREGLEYKLEDR